MRTLWFFCCLFCLIYGLYEFSFLSVAAADWVGEMYGEVSRAAFLMAEIALLLAAASLCEEYDEEQQQ